MQHTTGSVTLPSEKGKEDLVLELAKKWGADAIRDSHGTKVPEAILDLDFCIYSTICIVREDQDWIRNHKDLWVQKYFLSRPTLAVSDNVVIDLMANISKEVYEIDKIHGAHQWWEVIDRTTGEIVDPSGWSFDAKAESVVIHNPIKFHSYTATFLGYQIWDGNSMYNTKINNWKKDKDVSINPYHPVARKHVMEYLEKWLDAHCHTDIVRLTTLSYCYTFDIDSHERLKYWDWFGYTDCISTLALEDFEREYGYRLRPEHIVDGGYYNAIYKIPTPQYRDWMEFVHKFVVDFGKEVVERIHKAGKKAAIFWGDQWAGVEPYSEDYKEIGIDINVGACEDGVALRRLADLQGDHAKEIRLYPYFFPDVFREDGGRPSEESLRNWVKIRRAILRNCVDRIGYGGYLSLAAKFPDFVNHVEVLCNEFRTIKEHTKKTMPYSAPIRVGVLNYWGKLRSWVNDLGPDEKFYTADRIDIVEIAGSNILECFAGLPVSISFINFDDILHENVLSDFDVIVNCGTGGSSWSGERYWSNPEVLSAVKQFVFNGGGFIGVCEPSAYEYQGAYFQLHDVLGVQKEIGNTILMKYWDINKIEKHFITEDMPANACLSQNDTYVYPCSVDCEVLMANISRHVQLATNVLGSGRSVYISNLPYNAINTRLLHRALFWVSRKETELNKWFSLNVYTECAAYPEAGYFVVINNSGQKQTTSVQNDKNQELTVCLDAFETKWFPMQHSFK